MQLITSRPRRVGLGPIRWMMLLLVPGVGVAVLTFGEVGSSDRLELMILLCVYLFLLSFPFLAMRPRSFWYEPVIVFVLTRFLTEIPKLPYYLGRHVDSSAGLGTAGLLGSELYTSGTQFLALSSLAVLAYYYGYYVAPALPIPRIRFARASKARVARLLVALYLLSFGAAILFVIARGGISEHFARWSVERAGAPSFEGQVYWALLGSLHGSALLAFLAYDPRATRTIPFWAAVVVSGLALFVVHSGNRGIVIFFLGSICLLAWYNSGRLRLLSAVAPLVLVVMLFTALGGVRRAVPSVADLSTLRQGLVNEIRYSPLEAVVGYQMQLRPNVVVSRVPGEEGLLFGKSYLTVLANPVPRGLWPGKPSFVDSEAARTFWGVDWGLPIGAVAEAYWNFWIPGVLFAFALFGVFHRWLWRWLVTHPQHPSVTALYFTTLVYLWEPYSSDTIKWLRVLVPLVLIVTMLSRPTLYCRTRRGQAVAGVEG